MVIKRSIIAAIVAVCMLAPLAGCFPPGADIACTMGGCDAVGEWFKKDAYKRDLARAQTACRAAKEQGRPMNRLISTGQIKQKSCAEVMKMRAP